MARTSDPWLGIYAGAVSLLLVGAAPMAESAASLMPSCPFRTVTGLPCPTCGATHAVVALSRLDWGSALAANPLVTIGALALILGGLAAATAALLGRPLQEPRWGPASRWSALLLVLLNWVWVLAHCVSPRFPFSTAG